MLQDAPLSKLEQAHIRFQPAQPNATQYDPCLQSSVTPKDEPTCMTASQCPPSACMGSHALCLDCNATDLSKVVAPARVSKIVASGASGLGRATAGLLRS